MSEHKQSRKKSRYSQKFAELAKKKEGAFIPFVVLGDPDFATSKKIIYSLAQSADCLELGFPFSDPIADGKRIQAADERALSKKMSVQKCFSLLKHARKACGEKPIGLLVYYNLVYSNGAEKFLRKAKQAGADGILIADMPIEEASGINKLCRKIGLEQIFIISPATGAQRIAKIASKAKGFLYAVSILGVTGERGSVAQSTISMLRLIKRHSKLPVCVGFGISKPEHVKKVIRAGADGAIVGSAIEAVIENNLARKSSIPGKVSGFAQKLKAATRGKKAR